MEETTNVMFNDGPAHGKWYFDGTLLYVHYTYAFEDDVDRSVTVLKRMVLEPVVGTKGWLRVPDDGDLAWAVVLWHLQ